MYFIQMKMGDIDISYTTLKYFLKNGKKLQNTFFTHFWLSWEPWN